MLPIATRALFSAVSTMHLISPPSVAVSWAYDYKGRLALRIEKKRGKLTLAEIQDLIMYEERQPHGCDQLFHVLVHVFPGRPTVGAILKRRRLLGAHLPDQRLRYSAELAQRRVQASLERRGKRTGQPTNSGKAAGAAGR